MRRRVLPTIASLVLSVAALLSVAATGLAQQATTISIAPRTAQVEDLLREGRRLEIQRRWSEALTHYEDAVRQYPAESSLLRRFENTRLHYDLGRRYADRSFVGSITKLSLSDVLDLYGQVLVKVQAYYVEEPDWKDVVERGTNSFEVALSESTFLQRYLPQQDGPMLDSFRGELRRTLGPRVIQTRDEACNTVAYVAELAQQRLGVPATAVVLEYLCGLTNTLDPYSSYLTPDQLNEVYSQIEGNFVGLGVELKAEDGSLLIVRVIPGSPAEEGGILSGDRILAVDGQSTQDLSADAAANLLQGEEGSVVQLTVISPENSSRVLVIRRRRVEVPSIDDAQILDPQQGVAYLRLVCFQKTTSRDLDAALWRLHREGMRRLIMDLRGNPGGLLVTAVEVVDKFVERGVIVSTRGRSAQEDFTYSAHSAGTWRVPLVVLIDQDSASAAEIFAGAIRDHRRGTIVGVRSYGKGSVQGIFPLGVANSGIRLTTAKFYSPTGRPYSRVGVEPDVFVHVAAKPTQGSMPLLQNDDDDPMLTAAVQAATRTVMPQ